MKVPDLYSIVFSPQISGDANEDQILTAAIAYMDRPAMLTRVLNDLYYLFRYENNVHIARALAIVLEAMDQHLAEKHIQISGRYETMISFHLSH